MVGRGRGRGRGNQPQQAELAKMRRMIDDLTRAMQALQLQELVEARMENPKGDHNPFEIHNLEDDDEFENENPFHEDVPVNQAARVGLKGRLLYALDLNGGGIRIEVIDFHEKFHAEEYLDWEASLENYFEWKPMAENRKVLFVKLKLKGTALQW
ncbi:DNA/RNA polymerases superfamily protein isoform 2 [Theobroma cacao]|uniref:DNA/RNA polymerases superfamily protein isoform 2 n=1 Tax=Theobroma cacao TaxID=3641 RepID=A0A061FPZ8_THECC|nr:DNA/RNA polymerases superfamily protein isoform 2 [Theobroma cacao]